MKSKGKYLPKDRNLRNVNRTMKTILMELSKDFFHSLIRTSNHHHYQVSRRETSSLKEGHIGAQIWQRSNPHSKSKSHISAHLRLETLKKKMSLYSQKIKFLIEVPYWLRNTEESVSLQALVSVKAGTQSNLGAKTTTRSSYL
jgi:hypothetical protein